MSSRASVGHRSISLSVPCTKSDLGSAAHKTADFRSRGPHLM